MRFGPAGSPGRTSLEGVKLVRQMGLNALELEFVYGVKMRPETAEIVGALARKYDVLLTAHAPYYINLCSNDPKKREASEKRILRSLIVGEKAGVWSVVFHAGYYGSRRSEECHKMIKESLERILAVFSGRVWLRPETTGKTSQWGTIDEVIALSSELDRVLPCIDFAHICARTRGAINGFHEFRGILEKIEEALGKEAIENVHIHLSGIEWGERGEKRHRMLKESKFRWEDALKALKEFGAEGVIISESPVPWKDAVLLKSEWEELG